MQLRPSIFPKPKYITKTENGYYLMIRDNKNKEFKLIELTPYIGTATNDTTIGVINKKTGKGVDIEHVLKMNSMPLLLQQKLNYSYFVGNIIDNTFITDITLMYKGIKLGEI